MLTVVDAATTDRVDPMRVLGRDERSVLSYALTAGSDVLCILDDAAPPHSSAWISSLDADRRCDRSFTTKLWNCIAAAGWRRSSWAKRSDVRRWTRHAVSATTSADRGWPE